MWGMPVTGDDATARAHTRRVRPAAPTIRPRTAADTPAPRRPPQIGRFRGQTADALLSTLDTASVPYDRTGAQGRRRQAMTAGVTLAVIGAILAFALRADPSGIDLDVVGWILMLAGAALIWHALRGTTHERVITRVLGRPDTRRPPSAVMENRTVREVIQERERE